MAAASSRAADCGDLSAVLRKSHRSRNRMMTAVAQLSTARIEALDAEIASDAAALSILHHLPMAHSIIYATAQRFGATLWTQDADFEGLPGVRYFAELSLP
jgi:predicted nucleic acid-binding protein